jgi:TolA-binding protein
MDRFLFLRFVFFFFFIFSLSGCYTAKKEAEVKEELFNLQTRLLQIERQNKGTEKTAKVSIANNSTDIDRVKVDIQKINGEIDTLKVAVKNGEMPGTLAEEGSIAKTLKDILARLDAIEQNQKALEAAPPPVEKAKSKEGSKDKSGPKGSGAITTIKGLKSAYDSKNYDDVLEFAPKILPNLKTKGSKEEVMFLQAESLFKMNKMRDAALKYNDIIEMNPSSPQAPLMLLRMGDCFRSLGDSVTAKLYYEDLEKKHPRSEYVSKAKEYLKQIEEKGAAAKAKPSKTKVVQKEKKPISDKNSKVLR